MRPLGSFLEWTGASKREFAFIFSPPVFQKEAPGRCKCEKAWSMHLWVLWVGPWGYSSPLAGSGGSRMKATNITPASHIFTLHVHCVFLVPKPWHLHCLHGDSGGRLPSFLPSCPLLSILTLPPREQVIFSEEERKRWPREGWAVTGVTAAT